jgi:tripartite-type tricarboxylate transporter receptor subunit TctC
MPDVVTALAAQGAQPVGNSPEALAKIIDADTVRWAKVIKEAGIPLQ